jgi:hypothetical protein
LPLIAVFLILAGIGAAIFGYTTIRKPKQVGEQQKVAVTSFESDYSTAPSLPTISTPQAELWPTPTPIPNDAQRIKAVFESLGFQ